MRSQIKIAVPHASCDQKENINLLTEHNDEQQKGVLQCCFPFQYESVENMVGTLCTVQSFNLKYNLVIIKGIWASPVENILSMGKLFYNKILKSEALPLKTGK